LDSLRTTIRVETMKRSYVVIFNHPQINYFGIFVRLGTIERGDIGGALMTCLSSFLNRRIFSRFFELQFSFFLDLVVLLLLCHHPAS